MKIEITKLEQTDSFAKIISDYIQSSNELNIFYLKGNLGAGKTIPFPMFGLGTKKVEEHLVRSIDHLPVKISWKE